jgi:quercetin 2,3-dioxygenase
VILATSWLSHLAYPRPFRASASVCCIGVDACGWTSGPTGCATSFLLASRSNCSMKARHSHLHQDRRRRARATYLRTHSRFSRHLVGRQVARASVRTGRIDSSRYPSRANSGATLSPLVSGPVGAIDAPLELAAASRIAPPEVEVWQARAATVGTIRVRRSLPRRERRTVGAWCFADDMGPADVTETSGIDIGPHPHTGLHTVTWLLEGEVLHRDSLGSEQVIRPGQLNLMTAGAGVAHSEEATGAYRGRLRGVQLWVAQPESSRHGPPGFEHHAVLPHVRLGASEATILVGTFAGRTSPARADTPLVGVDAVLEVGTLEWPLEATFEHALLILDGVIDIEGKRVEAGHMAHLGLGRDALKFEASGPARLLLLGGSPFCEPLVMWWNFVARSRAEIESAAVQWNTHDPRFGTVSSRLARIAAPPVPDGLRR